MDDLRTYSGGRNSRHMRWLRSGSKTARSRGLWLKFLDLLCLPAMYGLTKRNPVTSGGASGPVGRVEDAEPKSHGHAHALGGQGGGMNIKPRPTDRIPPPIKGSNPGLLTPPPKAHDGRQDTRAFRSHFTSDSDSTLRSTPMPGFATKKLHKKGCLPCPPCGGKKSPLGLGHIHT